MQRRSVLEGKTRYVSDVSSEKCAKPVIPAVIPWIGREKKGGGHVVYPGITANSLSAGEGFVCPSRLGNRGY